MNSLAIKNTTVGLKTLLCYVNNVYPMGSPYTTIAANAVAQFQCLPRTDVLLDSVTALLDSDQKPVVANVLGQWWSINRHLIGKDIMRFHAVYWFAMLMSAKLPIPLWVFGHWFLTIVGQTLGKSLGNVPDSVELVHRYSTDAVRYYFLKEIESGRDGDFNEGRFIQILNADLASDLDHVLNRTLKRVTTYCDRQVPQAIANPFPVNHHVVLESARLAVISSLRLFQASVTRSTNNLGFLRISRQSRLNLPFSTPCHSQWGACRANKCWVWFVQFFPDWRYQDPVVNVLF